MTKHSTDRRDRAPTTAGRTPHPAGNRAVRWARLIVVGAGALGLSACVTATEQRAMDRGQCDEYGFQPGTDAFARCMMDVAQHREQMQQDRRLALQSQLALQNQERAFQQDRDKSLSLQRSGDTRFPVCGAASNGGFDPRAGSWYGPNCRAR